MDTTKTQTIEIIDMKKKITQAEIEAFLHTKHIAYEKISFIDTDESHRNVQVTIQNDALAITKLEILSGQSFPNHNNQLFKVHFLNDSSPRSPLIPKPKAGEEIVYDVQYDKLFQTDYERKLGSEAMVFTNKDTIDKQRAVFGYLMKKIGMNLFKGKSIMNISLPINIFDRRSLLDLWLCQNAYASILLELAGMQTNPLERLKYTTCFAISKLHLSGAQLKPFNPILGETFQAQVNDSSFYLEQTSHHPPITNFYGIGKHYKLYGHNESEASTGANSVKVYYKGDLYVQFPDGNRYYIIYPPIKLSGTMMGSRELCFRGKLIVKDEANDLITVIKLDPDERNVFEKMSQKKLTNPDYLSGMITSIKKNIKVKQNKKNKYSVIKKTEMVYSKIEGEFTSHVNFDGKTYWQYSNGAFPKMYRDNYTLPSDSTFREDLHLFRQNEEALAQKSKVRLEDGQRRDKKLRESYNNRKAAVKIIKC